MFLFLELGFPANIGLSWNETVGGMMVIPLTIAAPSLRSFGPTPGVRLLAAGCWPALLADG